MEANNINCRFGCCKLQTSPYICTDTTSNHERYIKAGGLLFDHLEDCILLVQSRGNLWGVPKGTLNENESPSEGAIREIKEETGLEINEGRLNTFIVLGETCTYYFIPHSKCEVSIQTDVIDNDANSIGWVKLNCLKTMIVDNKIRLTKHTKTILKKFLFFS
jgi:ADP-ribose pyrophosphatase YjhB (NUDIX family)